MKTMKTKLSIVSIFALIAGVFFSCDTPVALGKRLNLTPPVITIISPGFMETVGGGGTIDITGTATDNEEVTSIFITVERTGEEGEAWLQEWEGQKGAWKCRDAGANWVTRNEKGIVWKVNTTPGNISWSIIVLMEGAPDGEYLISARATNNVNNSSALVQRRVIIDINPPDVTIVAPVLKNYGELNPMPYELRNSAYLEFLHNKLITVQYEIKDDFSLKSLAIMLVDSSGNYYYNESQTLIPDDELGWSGGHDIYAKDIKYPVGHSKAGTVVDFLGEDRADALVLGVMSKVSDRAGNERIANHGYLVYWPDADRPWADGTGTKEEPDSTNGGGNAFRVYPGAAVQGSAYDNDGVKEVTYTLSHWIGSLDSEIETVTIRNDPLEAGGKPSSFFSWSFDSPLTPGNYAVDITVKDIYDVVNAQPDSQRYFYVYDVDMPSIEMDGYAKGANVASQTPDPDTTLFGVNGVFHIKGTVEDNTDPIKLTMVWINPADSSTSLDSYMRWQDENYSGWGSAPGTPGTSGTSFVTVGSDKVWNINLSGFVDPGAARKTKTFDISLDLAVLLAGGIPLKTQYFVLRVENNRAAVTRSLKFNGDTERPTVLIEKVTVKRTGVSPDKSYDRTELKRGTAITTLQTGDEITIEGSWGDNSLPATTGWQAGWTTTVLNSALELTWNDAKGSATLDTAGTWKGTVIIDDDQALLSGGFIKASLSDLAGNITEDTLSAKVDTSIPKLMFVSSDNADGPYGEGKEIHIYLEFTKPVSLSGSLPTITLSNGDTANSPAPGTIVYKQLTDAAYYAAHSTPIVEGKASKHYFVYTIDADSENTDAPLNVTVIDGAWAAESGNSAEDLDASSLDGVNRNLGQLKDIRVDTKPPEIKEITVIQLSGYYGLNRQFYIQVQFDERIQFTPGAGTLTNGAVLTLNVQQNNAAGTGLGAQIVLTNPQRSNDDTLEFTYTVANYHNTPFNASNHADYGDPLKAIAFQLMGTAQIADAAGNRVAPGAMDIPPGNMAGKSIVIDTIAPATPTVEGLPVGNQTQKVESFTIGNTEDNATVEYSLNGSAGPWEGYTGAVELGSTMVYQISARQTDQAGNRSPESAPIELEYKTSGPLVIGLADVSRPGTYKTGEIIKIGINLRETVSVGGSGDFSLVLNTTPPRTAAFTSVSGNALMFEYKVEDGDFVNTLEFSTINMATGRTITTTVGSDNVTADFRQFLRGPNPPAGGYSPTAQEWVGELSNYAEINVDTTTPSFLGASINIAQVVTGGQTYPVGTRLTLTFDKAVERGNGNITLAMTTPGDYRPPVVLTETEYNRYASRISTLSTHYKPGINGALANGEMDTSKKYILDIDSNGSTIANLFTAGTVNAHQSTVPVLSGVVSGWETNTIYVDLRSAAYELQVKGVNYTLSFPEDTFRDNLSNKVAAKTATVPCPGVNKPFIRVRKPVENFTNGTNYDDLTALRRADFRIDTQTPGAITWYSRAINDSQGAAQTGTNGAPFNGGPLLGGNNPVRPSFTGGANAVPTTSTTQLASGAYAVLGNEADNNEGRLYCIRAEARKDGYISEPSYARAARSVVIFNNIAQLTNWDTLSGLTPAGDSIQLFIRGGDGLSGQNLTDGFPLTWDPFETSSVKGARILRGPNNGDKVWITWDVDVPAYFHFLAGTTTSSSHGATAGPKQWGWTKNSWAFQHDKYPLYPGGCMRFTRGTITSSDATNNVEFYDTFSSGSL